MSAGYFLKYVDNTGLITDVSPANPLPVGGGGVSGGGTINVNVDQIGGVTVGGVSTWADKTIASLSGSSQTLFAANSLRKALIIKNGAGNVGINILGGTAIIGGAGTMTLTAFEGLTIEGGATPLGLITVIGTAANYCSAFEAT